MAAIMTDDAQQIRQWLEGVMRQTGLKATPLAKEAGLAPSTVLRRFEPPYLVTRTMDATVTAKPLLVDNERVKIMAVMTDLWRQRA